MNHELPKLVVIFIQTSNKFNLITKSFQPNKCHECFFFVKMKRKKINLRTDLHIGFFYFTY